MTLNMDNINKLFLKLQDTKALQLLYEFTGDELCPMLIEWKLNIENNYKDDLTTELGKCYYEVLDYLYVKYKIGKKKQ